MVTLGSIFAGGGGFEQGFEKLGVETSWQIEIDKNCNTILQRAWPNVFRVGDIKSADTTKLEDVDIITFGSPCQDFTRNGTQMGLDGYRSGVFQDAIYLIRKMNKLPRFILWENVPTVLRSNDGTDFATCLRMLANTGALDIGWRVLDARRIGGGVRQRRRRLFLVADFGGRTCERILFTRASETKDTPENKRLRRICSERISRQSKVVFRKSTNSVSRRGEQWEYGQYTNTLIRQGVGISQSMQTQLILERDTGLIRGFTPLEWERLMSWRDNHTEGLLISARYKLIANGVVSNTVEWIAERMLKELV